MNIKIVTVPVLDVWWLMRYPQSDIWILYNLLKTKFSWDSVSMKDYRFYFYDDFYTNLRKENLFNKSDFYKHQDIINLINNNSNDIIFYNNSYSLYKTIKNTFLNVDYLILPLTVYEQSSIEYFLSWLMFAYFIKKEFPKIKIITFWEYLSLYAKLIINEFDFLDAVILRWDKNAVANLISNFKDNNFSSIDNVIFKNNSELYFPNKEYNVNINNDLIPDYSWFDLDVHKMNDNKLIISYKLWEWCINNCFYCYNIHKWWKIFTKDTNKIVSEISSLSKQYKTNLYNFNDSEINYSNEFLNSLSNEIIKNNLKIFWSALIIPKNLDKDLLLLLYKSWCRQLRFWIESWSQRILDIIWKKTNTEEIEEILKNCKEIWISVYASFIVDLPQENTEDIKLTIEFINKNKELFNNIIICAYNTHIWNFDIKYFNYLLWKNNYNFCRTKRQSSKKILLRKICDKLGLYDIDIIDFLRKNF